MIDSPGPVTRFDAAFAARTAGSLPGLIPYFTAGYPRLDSTTALLMTAQRAGCLAAEVGIPFSDPLADGPTIQRTGQAALANGMTLARALAQVRDARGSGLTIPLAVMTYINPVLSFGVPAFAEEAAAAGVDGLIIPDLPLEEAADVRAAMLARGIAVIPLVAPTTMPERLARICAGASGFVYCVGVTGVTGARRDIADDAITLLELGASAHAGTAGAGVRPVHQRTPGGAAGPRGGGGGRIRAPRQHRRRPGQRRVDCGALPVFDDGHARGKRRVSEQRVGPAAHIDGVVAVPGDKSISHRALILGAQAKGRSYIGHASPAQDVTSTATCLRECGVWVRDFPPDRYALDGAGVGVSLRTPADPLDCGNSGTTMRLLAGVVAGSDCEATLDGDASLRRRPMARIAEPLRAMGAVVEVSPGGTAPLRIAGHRPLLGVTWRTPVASAQVKSAILLAGLSAETPTTVIEPLPTRDHTERMLRMCGIEVDSDGTEVTVHPGEVQPFGFRVPGDMSSAAFFLALAAARPGWRLRCPGLTVNPGRTGILEVLAMMGAQVLVAGVDPAGGVEPVGDVEVIGAPLHGVVIDGALTVRCIDELPVIAVLATQADGDTEIRDAGELRRKEVDRIALLEAGLRSLGAGCESTADTLVIHGGAQLRAARLDAAGDHRLAMAWGIAASLVPAGGGESVIAGSEVATVSYPGFFTDLGALTSA